uniref:Trypsin-1 n=2 Tax=Lygus hesperus TaxID=30085 RepID=A0A146M4M7_LYGHE
MSPGTADRRNVVAIKAHEEFHQPRAYNNDVALLKLEKPVALTNDRPPMCLPQPGQSFAGEMARVVGWGLTSENGTRSSWLLEADVPILNQRTCKGLSGFMTITDGMLCASPLDGGVDACQGDSGGPLLIKEEEGRTAIAGIVSWGIGCGRPNKPGIYTRVNHYLDWIVRNTQDGCFCY